MNFEGFDIDIFGIKAIKRSLEKTTDMKHLENWFDYTVKDNILYFYTESGIVQMDAYPDPIFSGARDLSDIRDLKYFDSSNVKSLNGFFSHCSSIKSLEGLGSWKTSNIRTMNSTFSGCDHLEDVSAIDGWNISNVTEMQLMFAGCTKLKNLPKWNMKNVELVNSMFSGCDNALEHLNLVKWDLSNAKTHPETDSIPDYRILCLEKLLGIDKVVNL